MMFAWAVNGDDCTLVVTTDIGDIIRVKMNVVGLIAKYAGESFLTFYVPEHTDIEGVFIPEYRGELIIREIKDR